MRVYHAEECRVIRNCIEVDDEELTYTIFGFGLRCRDCGQDLHDTIKAKKILVDNNSQLIVINPVEDSDHGNEEEKAIDDGILRLDLAGIT